MGGGEGLRGGEEEGGCREGWCMYVFIRLVYVYIHIHIYTYIRIYTRYVYIYWDLLPSYHSMTGDQGAAAGVGDE